MEKNYEIFENGQGKSQQELSIEKNQVTEIKDSIFPCWPWCYISKQKCLLKDLFLITDIAF